MRRVTTADTTSSGRALALYNLGTLCARLAQEGCLVPLVTLRLHKALIIYPLQGNPCHRVTDLRLVEVAFNTPRRMGLNVQASNGINFTAVPGSYFGETSADIWFSWSYWRG